MRPQVVAIINTSVDTVDLLSELLAEEGRFCTVTAMVHEFREGERDLGEFLRQHGVDAVVWDIAIPYEENWRYFATEVRPRHPTLPFVLTTTNRGVLERLVGPTGAFELMGKPFDLEQILAAVQRAIDSAQPQPARP